MQDDEFKLIEAALKWFLKLLSEFLIHVFKSFFDDLYKDRKNKRKRKKKR